MKHFYRLIPIITLLLASLSCALPGGQPQATLPPPGDPVPTVPAQPTDDGPAPTLVRASTAAPAPDPIQVFFTSSAGGANESGVLETALLTDLEAAQSSIDIAMYNLSLVKVENALAAAVRRGVSVRYVTDSDDVNDPPLQRLKKIGIKIVSDRRQSIMHNKFLVIDGALVWTGSLNLTGSGAYSDNNNFARFVSPEMAQNYTVEFEEMFLKDGFSTDGTANTPNPKFRIGQVKLENYFSPEDKISKHLTPLLNEAHTSIDFLAYSFTSDPLADAILKRAKAGVAVRGVFEDDQVQSNTGGEFERFREAGLDVRLDGNRGLMHHKVIIVDQRIVVFGSYNFSGNADRKNDENIVILEDAALAAQFEAEFSRLYAQAR